MILLSSPLKNDPPETTVSIFFLEIEIVTTKIVNSKSLRKICRQLLLTMNVLKYQRSYGFLITKKLIFGFQILDLKVHFSTSLK